MTELRDYQQELLEQVEAALRAPKSRVMLQLPTGGGKTHIAGALLAGWLRDGRKAVWLTHRAELSEQTRRMLNDARVSVINNLAWRVGDEAPYLRNGVVILMAQTVGRRTNNGKIWDIFNRPFPTVGGCVMSFVDYQQVVAIITVAGPDFRHDRHSLAAVKDRRVQPSVRPTVLWPPDQPTAG